MHIEHDQVHERMHALLLWQQTDGPNRIHSLPFTIVHHLNFH